MPDLGSTLSLNASEFAAGIAQARAKLTELNTALIENKSKMKEVSKEAQELKKREKELTEAMKDGGTREQQQELQRLRDRIGQVNSELGTLKTREREIQGDIRKATKELEEQKDGAKNLKEAANNATESLRRLESGLKAIVASVAGKKLFEVLIGSNAEMEQYLTSFEVMLGDTQKAQQMMSDLTNMAAKTPMELPDVVSAGTQLMNYGVQADKLIDTMTHLGDLAAGNAQKFERVSLAYGQMLAKGKVSGEELRQMTEAGVPLLQALADELNVSAGEVQKLISAGKVGIPELNAAIESMTTGTGKFAGMMEKQSKTMSGMLSTLSDEAAQFGRDVGEKAFGVAKEGLQELLDMIEEWRADGTLNELSEDVGEAIGDLASAAKDVIKFLVENKEAVLTAVKAFIALKGAMAIGGVVKGAISSIQSFTQVIQKLSAASGLSVATLGGIAAVIAEVAVIAVGVGHDLKIAFGGVSEEVEATQRSVERLTESMDDSISKNAAEMNVLQTKAAEYENLRNTQDRSAAQEERLKTLAGELQSVLGDEVEVVNSLTGEYNDLSAAVANYVEQQTRKVKFSALEDAAKGAYQKIDEIKRKMQERADENVEYQNTFSFARIFDYNGAVGEQSFLNDMAAYREEIAKCQKVIDEYEQAVSEGAYATAEAATAADEAAQKIDEYEEALARAEERTKTLDELTESTKNLVSEYSNLTDSLKSLQEGEAISYEKMQALIKLYPELAKHVKVTSDGYVVEAGAVGDLSKALQNSANAQIEAENAKTKAAIEGARDRIRLYQKEAEAAAMYEHDGEKVLAIGHKISEEAAYIEELEAKLAVNKTLPDYFQSNKGSSSGSSKTTKNTTTKEKEPPGLKSLMSYAKTASSAFKELKDNGELALSTVQALIDAGYDEKVVYQDAAGKWVINADEYKKAAKSQIDAAMNVEGATDIQKKALESLRGELSKVTKGLYDVEKAEEAAFSLSDADSNMSMLSKAFAEQNTNGTLSAQTVEQLKDTKYKNAFETTAEGTIRLKPKIVKDDISKELDKAIDDLEKQLQTASKGDIPALQAQIQAFKDLKEAINDVTEGLYGVEKAEEKVVSDEALKATEEMANRRLKQIDAELKAKQKLRDETLKAIDEEVQARKRLTEDNDIQEQINQVMAQLKYSQLDEFSRAQLERKLQGLQNDKADMLWERGIEDRRAAANEEYDTAAEKLNNEKEAINNSLEVLRTLNETVSTGIDSLEETIKAAMEAVKPDSTFNLTINNADKMTTAQLWELIEEKYGSTGAI